MEDQSAKSSAVETPLESKSARRRMRKKLAKEKAALEAKAKAAIEAVTAEDKSPTIVGDSPQSSLVPIVDSVLEKEEAPVPVAAPAKESVAADKPPTIVGGFLKSALAPKVAPVPIKGVAPVPSATKGKTPAPVGSAPAKAPVLKGQANSKPAEPAPPVGDKPCPPKPNGSKGPPNTKVKGPAPPKGSNAKGKQIPRDIFSGGFPVYECTQEVFETLRDTVKSIPHKIVEKENPNPHGIDADARQTCFRNFLRHINGNNFNVLDLFASPRDSPLVQKAGIDATFNYVAAVKDSKDFFSRSSRLDPQEVFFVETTDQVMKFIRDKKITLIFMNDVYRVFEETTQDFLERVMKIHPTMHIVWIGHLLPGIFGYHGSNGSYYELERDENGDAEIVTIPHIGASLADQYRHRRAFKFTCELKCFNHCNALFDYLHISSEGILPIGELMQQNRQLLGFGGPADLVYYPVANKALDRITCPVDKTPSALYREVYFQVYSAWSTSELIKRIPSDCKYDLLQSVRLATIAYVESKRDGIVDHRNSLPLPKTLTLRPWYIRLVEAGSWLLGTINNLLSNAYSSFLTFSKFGSLSRALIPHQWKNHPNIWIRLGLLLLDIFIVPIVEFPVRMIGVDFAVGNLLVLLIENARAVYDSSCGYIREDVKIFRILGNLGFYLVMAIMMFAGRYLLSIFFHALWNAINGEALEQWQYIAVNVKQDPVYQFFSNGLKTLIKEHPKMFSFFTKTRRNGETDESAMQNFFAPEVVKDADDLDYTFTHLNDSGLPAILDLNFGQEINAHIHEAATVKEMVPEPVLVYRLFDGHYPLIIPRNSLRSLVHAINERLLKYKGKPFRGTTAIGMVTKAFSERISSDPTAFKTWDPEELFASAIAGLKSSRRQQYEARWQKLTVEEKKDLANGLWPASQEVRFRDGFIKRDEKLFLLKPRVIICCDVLLNIMLSARLKAFHDNLKKNTIWVSEKSIQIGIQFSAGKTVDVLSQDFSSLYSEVANKGDGTVGILVAGDDTLLMCNKNGTIWFVEYDATAFDATQSRSILEWEVQFYECFGKDVADSLRKQLFLPIKFEIDGKRIIVNKDGRSSGFPNTTTGNSLVMAMVVAAGILGESSKIGLTKVIEELSTPEAEDAVTRHAASLGMKFKKNSVSDAPERVSFLRGFFYESHQINSLIQDASTFRWAPALGRVLKWQITTFDVPKYYRGAALLSGIKVGDLYLNDLIYSVKGFDWPSSCTIFDTAKHTKDINGFEVHPGAIQSDGQSCRYTDEVMLKRYGVAFAWSDIGALTSITKMDADVLKQRDYM